MGKKEEESEEESPFSREARGSEEEIKTKNSAQDNNNNVRTDITTPPLQELTRLMSAPKWAWSIVLSLWFLGGICLLRTFPLALLGYLALFVGWLYWDFLIVREDERAKPIFLGKIQKVIGSGPVFILRPLEKLRIYPTGVQQITFAQAGILTKTKDKLQQVVLPVIPVLNFQWPWNDEELTMAVRNAPPPTKKGLKELVNQLEEPFLDLVRSVGGQLSYEEISQKRLEFAQTVTEQLITSEHLIRLIGLFRLKNNTVSMKHIELPDNLKTALAKRAAALAEGEAEGIKERETRFGIAEGEYKIRRRILDVIKEYPESGMSVEALITLRETVKTGKAAYLVMPQQVYNVLSRALGAPAEQVISGISDKQFNELVAKLKEAGLK